MFNKTFVIVIVISFNYDHHRHVVVEHTTVFTTQLASVVEMICISSCFEHDRYVLYMYCAT